MSNPILNFGRSIPSTLREWDRAVGDLNQFVTLDYSSGSVVFVIADNAQLPTVPSLVDAARAFLPKENTAPFSLGPHMMELRAFERPTSSAPPVADSQQILANKIFGGRT